MTVQEIYSLQFLLVTVWMALVNAQKPVRSIADWPFEPAEELIYEAEFSRDC